MENNSDEQFWDFLRRNLFAVKKLILGLDDCVSKKDFDTAQIKINQLENELDNKVSEILSLRQENSNLQKDFDTAQIKINRLENDVDNKVSEIVSLRRENSNLQKNLERQADELQRHEKNLKSARKEISMLNTVIETYQKNYAEIEAAYNLYLKLPDEMKFGLQGIFGAGDNPTIFLAGALQNLDALFDYVANAINQNISACDVKNLRGIFEFAFAVQNKIHREEIFAPLNVKLGDDFNSSTMRKISSSRQSGVVKEIFLRGYKYRASGNIIRKTLVEIG